MKIYFLIATIFMFYANMVVSSSSGRTGSPVSDGGTLPNPQRLTPSALSGVLSYGRAVEDDLAGILGCYSNLTEADKHHLLVLPVEQRGPFFLDEIALGRMFVARLNGEIIGFCRMHIVVPSCREGLDIFVKELGVLQESVDAFSVPVEAKKFNVTSDQVKDYSRPLVADSINRFFRCNFANDVFIYFGTFYIKEPYRKACIGSSLELAALNSIKMQVLELLHIKLNPTLYYIYGVVDENAGSQGRLRSYTRWVFDTFLSGLSDCWLAVTLHTFQAFKPDLDFRRTQDSPMKPLLRRVSSRRDMAAGSQEFGGRQSSTLLGEDEDSGELLQAEERGISGKGCVIGCRLAESCEEASKEEIV